MVSAEGFFQKKYFQMFTRMAELDAYLSNPNRENHDIDHVRRVVDEAMTEQRALTKIGSVA